MIALYRWKSFVNPKKRTDDVIMMCWWLGFQALLVECRDQRDVQADRI